MAAIKPQPIGAALGLTLAALAGASVPTDARAKPAPARGRPAPRVEGAEPESARPAAPPPAAAVVSESVTPGPVSSHLVVRASLEGSAYHDTDHVDVVTPAVAATLADPVAGWSATGSYLVDAVSAASVDIVSSASRHWTELRHVGAASLRWKPHDFGVDLGGGVSREPDYLAIGVGGTLAWDLFDKNLTAVLGGSYGDETAGRSGTPFSELNRRLFKYGVRGGATVIVDPATTYDLVTEGIFERGDQAKPYRYVALFAPGASARLAPGASIDEVNGARLSPRPAERLPLERNRLAVTNRLAHRLSGSALRLEERLYADDWGMKASTTDARWVLDVGRRLVLWPHLRAHFQGPVSFWQRAYEVQVGADGATSVPEIRTGDRELGPLHSWTAGGGLRLKLGGDHVRWSLTLQGDAVVTSYADALFISERTSFFSAFGVEAELD